MKVFISWSGELSHVVALLLKEWLRHVIQVVEPYVSSEDIEKGSRWFTDIDSKLDDCNFGIVCLTRENMAKPWILFEAGAISRSISQSRVTPLLIDISPADLSGPLSQFQATHLTKIEMLKLAKDIARQLNDPRFDDALIEESFDKWWPNLHTGVKRLVESSKDSERGEERRSDRAILEELLQLTRNLTQLASAPPSQIRSLADDIREKQRLREMAENNPVVKNVLRTFRGEIVDVHRAEEEQG